MKPDWLKNKSRNKSVDWLVGKERDEFSQTGEDGIIEAALDRLGIQNEWCFEVGAANGIYLSNTKRLRDLSWHAVLVEKDPDAYEKLSQFESNLVHTALAEVDATKLEAILDRYETPANLDLGIIDIDGNDYWLWHDLSRYRPRLMLVEFGCNTDPDFLPKRGEGAVGKQAGLYVICQLGYDLGYEPLAKTSCNLLFCLSELC